MYCSINITNWSLTLNKRAHQKITYIFQYCLDYDTSSYLIINEIIINFLSFTIQASFHFKSYLYEFVIAQSWYTCS
jgi:hypothetical protein